MKLLFLFDGDLEAEQYTVEIVSSEGLELSIHFKECEIDCFYIGGCEFTNERRNILNWDFLNFGKGLDLNILPLASVLQQATSQIQGMIEEYRQEAEDNERHFATMRCASRYI